MFIAYKGDSYIILHFFFITRDSRNFVVITSGREALNCKPSCNLKAAPSTKNFLAKMLI